jgi:ribonuclease-3
MQELHNILQATLKYTFKDISLLEQSLTHKSYAKQESNERLEFLGDAVLDLIVAEFLYAKFATHNEGKLSRLRASLVNEKSFAKLAKNIDIANCLYMSVSEQKNKGRDKPSILSDAFEALMGAIYLDGDINEVKKVFLKLLNEEYKTISLDNLSSDYKSKLQEITQAKFGVTPLYKLEKESGPDHKKEFELSLWINDKCYGRAKAKSKKLAQQKVAKKTIVILNK